MLKAGIHIVPFMPPDDVVTIACEAERIGYDFCLVADEGFQADVYACLSVIAAKTGRIRIGPVTNGYTRHPAVTAAALATLDSLSDGRAFVTLLAGGSMVLEPMGITRAKPYRVVRDTIEVLRRLWTGEEVTWEGEFHRLQRARLAPSIRPANPSTGLPIWVAGRGPMILRLAGRQADGVLLTVKPDLAAALEIVDDGALSADRPPPARAYLGRICYTPEMVAAQRATLPFVLMDSPSRVLESLGLDGDQIGLVEEAAARNDPALVEPLVTDELLGRYQVTGTPGECAAALAALHRAHDLTGVMADVLSTDPAENLELLETTYEIIQSSREQTQ